jgi:hypothetical protein
MLTPYAQKIIRYHQSGFRRDRSTTDHIFCISSLINFNKSYDSVKRDVLYNTVIEFGISMQMVRLIKICLNETYSTVRVGNYLTCFLLRTV